MLTMSSIFNLYKLLSHSCIQYFYISNHYNSIYIVKITRIAKFKKFQEDTQDKMTSEVKEDTQDMMTSEN